MLIMDNDIRSLERILISNPFDNEARARYTFWMIKTGNFVSIKKRLAKAKHRRTNNPPRKVKRVSVMYPNILRPGKPYRHTKIR